MKILEVITEPVATGRRQSGLPEPVLQAFERLGRAQRDRPESAMLKVQHRMGGGVLNPVVEHLGDITHRMSHMARANIILGYDKVQKVYDWLTRPYGFEREMSENIRNNANYRGVREKDLHDQIVQALADYGREHSHLPVYNEAQYLAKMAAVSVGRMNFEAARTYLALLIKLCPDEQTFKQKALEFQLNQYGEPARFQGY